MIGLNSPWGNLGEIIKTYGWSLDYLLWRISWLNVQIMLMDAPRHEPQETDENGKPINESTVIHRELKTKEDIKNYIKGII